MTWTQLVLWYLSTVAIGTTGSYLAYAEPVTSRLWINWARTPYPWAVDALRLVIASTLSLFIIWSLGVVDAQNDKLREKLLEDWVIAVPMCMALLNLAGTLLYAPHVFALELAARGQPGSSYDLWRDIYVPYIPYFFYSAALWVLAALPPMLCVILRVRTDFAQWKQYRAEFLAAFAALPAAQGDKQSLLAAQLALQNYVVRLQQVGERALPVILSAVVLMTYEQITPSHKTTLAATQSLMKVLIWLLMGPAALSLVAIVALGYQTAIRSAERVYRELLATEWGTDEVRKELIKTRDDMIWKGDGGTFIATILKSSGVLVLLIASGVAYVLKAAKEDRWMAIFVPEPVVDLLSKIFVPQ